MSEALSKLRLARVEPSPEAGWPKWIADALAYNPECQVPELGAPGKKAASETNERRNIRILSRALKT